MLFLLFKEEEALSGDRISGLYAASVKRDTFATTSNSEKLVWAAHEFIDFFSSFSQQWQIKPSLLQPLLEEIRFFFHNL